MVDFFGRDLASTLVAEGRQADLLVANNVLAHVPDLNDFVGGMERVLAPDGVVTIEFPHLARLIEANQFDTIYHEHFSYFSLLSARSRSPRPRPRGVRRRRASHARRLAARLRRSGATMTATRSARAWRSWPSASGTLGLDRLEGYTGFAQRVERDQAEAARVPDRSRRDGKRVAGYGAPGKGNTLLNYCGIRTDLLEFTVDRNPYKQGQFLPGHAHPDPRSRASSSEPGPTSS